MTDLNSLIPAGSSCELIEAPGIDEADCIRAIAIMDSARVEVKLAPVQAP